MTTLVTLDTQYGVTRRYENSSRPTHVGVLTRGHEGGCWDAIQEFRQRPPVDLKIKGVLPLIFPIWNEELV